MRGQTTLPVLGIALVLLTSVSVLAVVTAQGSIQRADEASLERAAAISISERVVERRSELTTRPNVLAASKLEILDEKFLRENLSISSSIDARITIGGEQLLDTGARGEVTSFERIIMIERTTVRRRSPNVRPGAEVTLPRRVDRVRIRLDPPSGTVVRAVAADGQIVLANESGLAGTYVIAVSRFETTAITVDAVGPLTSGDVRLRYEVPQRHRARLVVSVDA